MTFVDIADFCDLEIGEEINFNGEKTNIKRVDVVYEKDSTEFYTANIVLENGVSFKVSDMDKWLSFENTVYTNAMYFNIDDDLSEWNYFEWDGVNLFTAAAMELSA